jgi:hypothetical protein
VTGLPSQSLTHEVYDDCHLKSLIEFDTKCQLCILLMSEFFTHPKHVEGCLTAKTPPIKRH